MKFKPNYKGIVTGLAATIYTLAPLGAFAQDNYNSNSQQESKLEQSISENKTIWNQPFEKLTGWEKTEKIGIILGGVIGLYALGIEGMIIEERISEKYNSGIEDQSEEIGTGFL